MAERLNPETTSRFLKEALLARMPQEGGLETGIPGLYITRWDRPSEAQWCFYVPMIIVLAQGSKHVFIGSKEFRYGENQCMITGLDLPGAGKIITASPEKPFIGVVLNIDQQIIANLLSAIPRSGVDSASCRGVAVDKVDPLVADAFLRLTELIGKQDRQEVLAPMIIREIHYLLLMGPLGNQLRMIHTYGSPSNQVARAIAWLKNNYHKPLNTIELAKRVDMAPSTFNRHFREMTTLSPLQYQKRLRLYEAQRLMLVENQNAVNAGYTVGYESLTQFNREYKRMFGEPPYRDIQRIINR